MSGKEVSNLHGGSAPGQRVDSCAERAQGSGLVGLVGRVRAGDAGARTTILTVRKVRRAGCEMEARVGISSCVVAVAMYAR